MSVFRICMQLFHSWKKVFWKLSKVPTCRSLMPTGAEERYAWQSMDYGSSLHPCLSPLNKQVADTRRAPHEAMKQKGRKRKGNESSVWLGENWPLLLLFCFQATSGCVQILLYAQVGSRDHMGCQGLDLGWLHARQVPYPHTIAPALNISISHSGQSLGLYQFEGLFQKWPVTSLYLSLFPTAYMFAAHGKWEGLECPPKSPDTQFPPLSSRNMCCFVLFNFEGGHRPFRPHYNAPGPGSRRIVASTHPESCHLLHRNSHLEFTHRHPWRFVNPRLANLEIAWAAFNKFKWMAI